MTEILVVANRTLGGEKLLETVRERAAAGDVQLPTRRSADQALGWPDLPRRDGAGIGPGTHRSGDFAAGQRGHRGNRRSRRRRSLPGHDGRDRPAAARRGHRLHPSRHTVGMAAQRSDRAHTKGLWPTGRAHRRGPCPRGSAVRGDSGRGAQDLQRRRADRASFGQGRRRGAPPVHRRRPPTGPQRRRPPRGAHPARGDARTTRCGRTS